MLLQAECLGEDLHVASFMSYCRSDSQAGWCENTFPGHKGKEELFKGDVHTWIPSNTFMLGTELTYRHNTFHMDILKSQ